MILIGVAVAALAGSRLARAIALDTISEPARAWVYKKGYGVRPTPYADDGMAAYLVSRPWAWAYGLLSCPFCIGFWLTIGLYALWTEAGWARWPLAALAAAGAQAALTSWTLPEAR